MCFHIYCVRISQVNTSCIVLCYFTFKALFQHHASTDCCENTTVTNLPIADQSPVTKSMLPLRHTLSRNEATIKQILTQIYWRSRLMSRSTFQQLQIPHKEKVLSALLFELTLPAMDMSLSLLDFHRSFCNPVSFKTYIPLILGWSTIVHSRSIGWFKYKRSQLRRWSTSQWIETHSAIKKWCPVKPVAN